MHRRDFLKGVIGAGVTVVAGPDLSRAWAAAGGNADASVKTVHVIFKTHLDIGYTDMPGAVIKRYFDDFIPRAMELAASVRRSGTEDRFVWTTGSWLVYEFLERAPADLRRKMERAIEARDFVWHGLPFTTHTELMDSALFKSGLGISAALDRRFGRTTISSKMTDVPGHTRSVVAPLAGAGIRLLHIGVNPASMPPDVPPLFNWIEPGGAELMVMYQREYGSTMVVPQANMAVAICFTGDNHGPQAPEQVAQIYQGLRRRFPAARLVPSDFNAVAAALHEIRSTLPVIRQELGDTWIHGGASDPVKIIRFRELCRLHKEWLASGRLKQGDTADLAFARRLLLVPEHTWGCDVKRYLKDWDVYTPAAVAANRDKPNFRKMEAAWNEKRAYNDEAIATLPADLADAAKARLKQFAPAEASIEGFSKLPDPTAPIDTPHFVIGIDPATGAIRKLQSKKTGREWAGADHLLGLASYQTFSQKDYERFFNQYLTQKPDWAIGDFGRIGLEKIPVPSRTYTAVLRQVLGRPVRDGYRLVAELDVPNIEPTFSGCPKRLVTELFLPDAEPVVHLNFSWFDKPANRLPEAIWLAFSPVAPKADGWSLDKMDRPVSPLDVVKDGNRHLHGVTRGVSYRDEQGELAIDTLDAPIVAPGEPSLLDFNNRQPDMGRGVSFNLFNNVWGTNFIMWFGEDMRFRFVLRA